MEAYQNAALSPEERAKDLLGKMTLQEKVGQLNQRLYGFRIYERQGEEFTLTEEFKEEVERMGGLGVLYGLYRADPWADKDEKTGIVLELSAKAYNIVQKYVIDHSRLGIPMMMSTECPHGHQALGGGLLPVNLAAGATFDPELLSEGYKACGKQLKSGCRRPRAEGVRRHSSVPLPDWGIRCFPLQAVYNDLFWPLNEFLRLYSTCGPDYEKTPIPS